MNCAICHKPVTRRQAAIDHLVPRAQAGQDYNIETNIQTVHIACNRKKRSLWRRIMRWLGFKRLQRQLRRDANKMCYKRSKGYSCQHKMHGNVKECGGQR